MFPRKEYPTFLLTTSRPGAAPFRRAGANLLFLTILAVLSTSLAQVRAQQATLTTLHSFGTSDGKDPETAPVQASDGNFYGTTYQGGTGGVGTVYRLTPAGALKTLHSFTGGSDGQYPSGLVQASDGNLYGTTYQGGDKTQVAYGDGTVFRITPAGVLTTLHAFGGAEGATPWPFASLVQGSDGNLYGTTQLGGTNDNGTVFRITLAGTLTSLYKFTGGSDGGQSEAGLVEGKDGNFYGTTARAGSNNDSGTVFRMTPAGALTTLHVFNGTDGSEPSALVQGSDGNFYGTTFSGGADQYGTVFRVTPAGAFTSLYSFAPGTMGAGPESSLVQGNDGNFYGTTYYGGANVDGADGYGTVFRVTAAGKLTTLYSFTGNGDEGYINAGVVQGSDGSLYGATGGGSGEGGTLYKLSVGLPPAFFDGEAALGNGVYFLSFASGNPFGYYSFLTDSRYIYHFDLGYEYAFDAEDGKRGVYFYDFKSSTFFYTSPTFPFPYLYDFSLNTVLYYYPDPGNPGRYNTNGVRYFYDFATGKIISK